MYGKPSSPGHTYEYTPTPHFARGVSADLCPVYGKEYLLMVGGNAKVCAWDNNWITAEHVRNSAP